MTDKFIRITVINQTETSVTEEKVILNTRYVRNLSQFPTGEGLIFITDGTTFKPVKVKENLEQIFALILA